MFYLYYIKYWIKNNWNKCYNLILFEGSNENTRVTYTHKPTENF